jgi:tetratricopeptide (TPR) repeat protein
MSRMPKHFVAALVAALLLVSATGCTKLRARDALNKGVQAFKGAKYPEAIEYFQKSVELDPAFPIARLYLAMAYMSQYIPGAESEENVKMAKNAYDEFQRVLELEPKNAVALASIASLYYHQKKFDEAEVWYRKVIDADPNNKEAYYTLGVIAWGKTFPKRMEARAKLGMKPEDPGPIKDKKVREELAAANIPIIDEGLKSLEAALKIDPEYDDSMAYMNLLHRERADLQPDPTEYKKDTEIADGWVQKTLETKKIKNARAEAKAAAGQITSEGQ